MLTIIILGVLAVVFVVAGVAVANNMRPSVLEVVLAGGLGVIGVLGFGVAGLALSFERYNCAGVLYMFAVFIPAFVLSACFNKSTEPSIIDQWWSNR
jgi:hypothetical protein